MIFLKDHSGCSAEKRLYGVGAQDGDKRTRAEAVAMIRREAMTASTDEGGSRGGGEEWLGCAYVLKKNQMVFTNIAEVGCEKERREG